MSSGKVLIVDDDAEIREMVARYLRSEQFETVQAGTGEEMLRQIDMSISLVLLDINLPGDSGFDLARRLHKDSSVGIIMMTGRTDVIDKVVALEIGADDYLAKPFELRELVARVRAVLRRRQGPHVANGSHNGGSRTKKFQGWTFDPARRQLTNRDGENLSLTSAEFSILEILVANQGNIVSRRDIHASLKGGEWSPLERGVDIHIGHLRRKLELDPANPQLIKTIHGQGYQLAIGNEADSS